MGDNFFERVSRVQNELKAPKNHHNKFGNYNYRNAEDIEEAAKPICAKYRMLLRLTDDIVLVGDRYYVKATATLFDFDSDKTHEVNAYAREDETKKGMDGSQITGSSSSYARKYALNGLFQIDDTKDADSDEYKVESDNRAEATAPQKIDSTMADVIRDGIGDGLIDEAGVLKFYHVSRIEDLQVMQGKAVCDQISKRRGNG